MQVTELSAIWLTGADMDVEPTSLQDIIAILGATDEGRAMLDQMVEKGFTLPDLRVSKSLDLDAPEITPDLFPKLPDSLEDNAVTPPEMAVDAFVFIPAAYQDDGGEGFVEDWDFGDAPWIGNQALSSTASDPIFTVSQDDPEDGSGRPDAWGPIENEAIWIVAEDLDFMLG